MSAAAYLEWDDPADDSRYLDDPMLAALQNEELDVEDEEIVVNTREHIWESQQ